jgi:lactoylglutathione lyase
MIPILPHQSIYTKMMRNILSLIFILSLVVSFSAKAQSNRPAKINHTAIYVMNVKTSAAFYKEVIGLDTVPEPFHDGKHAWFSMGSGITLHIIEGATAKKEYYKNQHTCFSVASVDAFTQLLRKRNINWEDRDGKKMTVTTRVDGVKQLWLQDPDGYWIEVNDAKD